MTEKTAMLPYSTVEKYNAGVPRYTSYPTANHFHQGVGNAQYHEWLKRLPEDEAISLYLHIPFCKKMCWYCGCNTRIVSKYEPVSNYAKNLATEIELVASYIGRKQKVSHVQWGGGTPTYLSSKDFEFLFSKIHEAFDVQETAEVSVEIDPRTLAEEKVATLAKLGVNRASLGVQDFDPAVQEAINRVQPYEQTAQTVNWLRIHGIQEINFDLIYGLPLQTLDTIRKSVKLTKQLEADRVALFGYAHVPWFKSHQKVLEQHHLPTPEERYEMFNVASDAFISEGYTAIGIDHFALENDSMTKALKNKTLHRNFQGYTVDNSPYLIGLGASSISCLPDGFAQNSPSTKAYEEAVSSGLLSIVRGIAVNDRDILVRAVIEQLMCYFEVDLEAVATTHQQTPDILAGSMPRLKELEEDGFITVDKYKITILEHGKPLTRVVAACFDTFFQEKENQHAQAV
jgi:oxygen-independent coproporphyrinogen-3 oxidase